MSRLRHPHFNVWIFSWLWAGDTVAEVSVWWRPPSHLATSLQRTSKSTTAQALDVWYVNLASKSFCPCKFIKYLLRARHVPGAGNTKMEVMIRGLEMLKSSGKKRRESQQFLLLLPLSSVNKLLDRHALWPRGGGKKGKDETSTCLWNVSP